MAQNYSSTQTAAASPDEVLPLQMTHQPTQKVIYLQIHKVGGKALLALII